MGEVTWRGKTNMRNLIRTVAAIAIAGCAFNCPPALAQDEVRRVDVRFAAGTSGASYSDTIVGYNSIEYFLTANAGQRMRIDLSTSNLSNYFNVWPPGGDAAIFVGASSGDTFDGILPQSGEYRVQVFLMRNAARRNETANFTIDISITGATAFEPPTQQPDFADGLAGGPDWWRIGTGSGGNLNIRSGPGRQYAVVTSLPSGSVVRNLGCQATADGRWCQVDLGNDRGWASGPFLTEAAAPSNGQPSIPVATPTPSGEFADGDAGGPDWFAVQNVPAGDRLNIRSGPSTGDTIVGRADNGMRLRNLGCRSQGQARWCQVETSDGSIRGWVNARFIGEGSLPQPVPTQPAADVPELVRRTTGEFEVGFASGCMLLFNPAGNLITAGSTCSPMQSVRAAEAVAAFRREQGL
jgi:uncharacterized protein YraI